MIGYFTVKKCSRYNFDKKSKLIELRFDILTLKVDKISKYFKIYVILAKKISMSKKSNNILFVFAIVLISSCVSKKDIVYFQNDAIDQSKVSNSYKTIIKPDDVLQITITALDTEAVRPFNLAAVNYATTSNTATGTPQLQTYLVDTKGEIDFPVLGKLKIGGLTRDELIAFLKHKLAPDYILNPNINVRITNYKVTVLGAVRNPGSYTIPNERITILEALGLAGDLNISALRNNILVQREENGKKTQYRVDLLSKNIFTSPVYYLQQNDVVYVEQNYASIQSASSNSNTSLIISVTSLLIGIITLIIR
ncbi:polysaccharide export outer membrane protein [Polaribacter sp. KT25b]|uniref:polysaccharide biosynthesis/export family protein n=1 Tax=Polaribacter sp. KT25b TaxID=1855336 RepID=UPI00087A58A2|nr:polysaccharide biosynthesis/export family protein [Polaribacter sp. KT25b]SDS26296.1 polysaccharide export outer membrane protein [Polaribacter sp. KT25b]